MLSLPLIGGLLDETYRDADDVLRRPGQEGHEAGDGYRFKGDTYRDADAVFEIYRYWSFRDNQNHRRNNQKWYHTTLKW